jgi:hypothetical protein
MVPEQCAAALPAAAAVIPNFVTLLGVNPYGRLMDAFQRSAAFTIST